MSPVRIQRQRRKGWRIPTGAVYVGRPTKWGNPYKIGKDGSREQVIAMYARDLLSGGVQTIWIEKGVAFMGITPEIVWAELHGKDLVCWCPPWALCHADVLLEVANQ
jgi:hypothetical protein